MAGEFLNSAKFSETIKISHQRESSAAWLEIPRPRKMVCPNDYIAGFGDCLCG